MNSSKNKLLVHTQLLLITGRSGAGRTSLLKLLEDLGYEVMDNVPVGLLVKFLSAGNKVPVDTHHNAIAVGIDIRTREFSATTFLEDIKPVIQNVNYQPKLVFMDCDEEVLARRYTESRRRHPLSKGNRLLDSIRLEDKIIEPLRNSADLVIDTSTMSLAELRPIATGYFGLKKGPTLTITLTSFSFAKGLPRESDLVFDVRFLVNPHHSNKLRPMSGQHPNVAAYIEKDPSLKPFMQALEKLLNILIPRYNQEGKSYLTIAVGCTGGKHRSVYVTECLAKALNSKGTSTLVQHRDWAQL